MNDSKTPTYSVGEECFNSISHGVGAALGIAATVILIVISAKMQDGMRLACAIIYGSSLIMLYTMSTLYHALRGRAKKVMRVFDHCSIYLLIAGSYAPFLMITLRGTLLGYILMGIIGVTSIIAIVLNVVSIERFKTFSHIAYVALGWSAVFAIKPLFTALPPMGIILLVGGGLFYTLGLIFYALKKYKYMHSIWHLFVLAGSITQFICIMYYVFLAV